MPLITTLEGSSSENEDEQIFAQSSMYFSLPIEDKEIDDDDDDDDDHILIKLLSKRKRHTQRKTLINKKFQNID
jgi:hypothetical protein